MKRIKKIGLIFTAAAALLATACSTATQSLNNDLFETNAARSVYESSNGKIDVTGMTDTSITVKYTSGKLNYARIFISEGNGMGLVLANQDMTYENGAYSYTFKHPTFTSESKIHIAVLINDGTEKIVPQGTLADTASWTSIIYGKETSSSSSSTVSSSLYAIICKCSGKALDNDAWSTTSGTNIHQWAYGDNQANQQWSLSDAGNGYFYIVNSHSSLCLSVENDSKNDGANVVQSAINGKDSQKWALEEVENGFYKITNKNSGKVLDVAWASKDNGANVQQCTWNTGDAQRWSLNKVSEGSAETPSTPETPSNPENPATQPESPPSTPAYSKYLNNETLIGLNGGLMTMQFKNTTNGAWSDDQIFITTVALDSSSRWCYLNDKGQLVPISANSTSQSWSYSLAQLKNGIQMPAMTSGRLYVGMGSPVTLKGVLDAAGNVGIAQPDLNNPQDSNHDKYFDWIEFTLSDAGFWGNTTQVDQFSFPIVMAMYNTDGYYRSVGVTETREQIFSQFEALGGSFATLVQRPYRIVAPCKGQFRVGRADGNYMDSYVNECWNYYLNKKNVMHIKHPLGDFDGYSTSDGKFVFTCTASGWGSIAQPGKNYYVKGKPNNDELFEGSGVLASPSDGADGNQTTVELALQAWVCAALNRHIFTDPANWSNPSAWYKNGPANFYADFWHKHNIDGAAYGFCYDDVFDQSSLIQTGNPRGLVIGIGW